MKKLTLLVLILSLNAISAPNSIVAIVNDSLVTYDEINVKSGLKADKLAAVNQQIDIILQMERIAKLGLEPKTSVINSTLARVAQQNSLSLSQIQENPEFDQIMKDIRQKLSLNGLKEFVNSKAEFSLSQVEINQALDNNPATEKNNIKQMRIAQIAISSIDKSASLLQSEDQLIKAFLEDLSNKITQGESFSALAKLHSQDESYKNGGESGWLIRTQLPEEFLKMLEALELQELSTPFKMGGAWRLVKVIEKRQIDNHLKNIKSKLMREKKNIHFSNWLKKLRQNAYIEIFEHKL
ncbi:peptidylprolyl isomerase [Candidatus Thioglobus sp.]|uniref:peptidylprolyl isomerase n=1 Tax=Candidatus Thioglobus sp. TaxID=2026721 RepID=UPI003D0C97B7